MAFLSFSKACCCYTNASDFGLGAILTQKVDGEEWLICCASHSLNDANCNYVMTKQENLVVSWGLHTLSHFFDGSVFQGSHWPLQLTLAIHHEWESALLHQWQTKLEEFPVHCLTLASCNWPSPSVSSPPTKKRCKSSSRSHCLSHQKNKVRHHQVSHAQSRQSNCARIPLWLPCHNNSTGSRRPWLNLGNASGFCTATRLLTTFPTAIGARLGRHTPSKTWRLFLRSQLPLTQPSHWYFDSLPLQPREAMHCLGYWFFLNLLSLSWLLPMMMLSLSVLSWNVSFPYFSTLICILSDQSSNLPGCSQKKLMQLLDSTLVCTSLYHPQGNAAVEQAHSRISSSILQPTFSELDIATGQLPSLWSS